MRAKEVLEVLGITRPTLCKYVKQGLIKIDSCINGQYRYNRESVVELLNGKKEGKTRMNLSEKLKLNYPKTTAQMKKVKEELALLERRTERLSVQIKDGANELVIRQELRLIQEVLNKLKEDYNVN